MTESDQDELKKLARQDAIYLLVIALISMNLNQQKKPLEAAEDMADVIGKALRNVFFYEYDSTVAQIMHEAILSEVKDIIRRALPEAVRERFAPIMPRA